MRSWFIGGVVGIIILWIQVAFFYMCSSQMTGVMVSKCQDIINPALYYFSYDFNVTETVIFTGALYFLIGSFLGLLMPFATRKERPPLTDNVKNFIITLAFIPVANLALILYGYVQSFTSTNIEPLFTPLPNLYRKVEFMYYAYFAQQVDGFMEPPVDSWVLAGEAVVFTLIIVGLYLMRRWAYYLLIFISSVVTVFCAYNLLIHAHRAAIYTTAHFGAIFCYFVLILFFFTYPSVKNQFD